MAVGILFDLCHEDVEVSMRAGAKGLGQAVDEVDEWLFVRLGAGCLEADTGSGRELDLQA